MNNKKTRVLIVEDEKNLALNVKEILELFNYEVIGIFPTAQEVIEHLENNKTLPDIILMDILLEGDLDGIDLTYILRDKYDIPIVFVTAYSDKGILDRISQVLYEGYLLKPFTSERLTSSIYLAIKEFQSNADKKKNKPTLKIRDKGYIVPVPEEEIMFLKADGLYTKVFTEGRSYMMRDILKDIGLNLSSNKFLRVHKSYLINIDKVHSINSKEICIGKYIIPIRRGAL